MLELRCNNGATGLEIKSTTGHIRLLMQQRLLRGDWPRAFLEALMYGERTQFLLKTRGMLGRASSSLGPGPWELPSSPEALM